MRSPPEDTEPSERTRLDLAFEALLARGDAVLVLDAELRVHRFSPGLEAIFELAPGATGRPLSAASYRLDDWQSLLASLRAVRAGGDSAERELLAPDGRSLRRRVAALRSGSAAPHGFLLSFTDVSEVETLRARLRLATTSARLYWWDWDVAAGLITRYGAHPEFLGQELDRTVLSAEEWTSLIHPDDLPLVLSSLEPCHSGTGQDWCCELRLRTKHGTWRWVASGANVIERDAEGRALRLRGTTQDVHDRRTAEDLARRDAQLFSCLQDSIVCTDMQGIITSWNEGATRLYGFRADEMLGRPIFERFAEDVRPRVLELHNAIAAGHEFRGEWPDKRKDGSEVWVECRISRFSDHSGRPSGIIGIARDISERRLVEHTVRRDAHILAQLQDAVVCTDAELRVVYWNQAAESIFGWKSEDLLGSHLNQRFPSHMHDSVQLMMTGVLGRDETPATEFEDYRKDGSRVWMYWRARRQKDTAGRVIGTVSVGTDMTERRRAADEHRLLEQQLFHAQKMETIGTLAGGIAHDFNNILAAIVIYTELAMSEAHGNERGLEFLGEVKRASQRAKELVRRILAFSRFNEPDRRRIDDLRSVIDDAVRFVRPMLPATLEIRLEFPERCPPTRADHNQIHQVILNLISNAAQAMKQGAGVVSVRLGEREFSEPLSLPLGPLKAGRYLAVAIADDGQGMDAATVKRIFDPFFTTKKQGEGTGLGLSVVHGIIHNHHGGLEVTSAPGQGSTFVFYLPVTTDSRARAPDSAAPQTLPRGQGERVLVIDDEEVVARLTTAALETLGYSSAYFTSVDDFFREFERAPDTCHLIITDQTMPRVTGLELAVRVRAQGHTLPILLATGFSRVLTPTAVTELGRAASISKPFEIQELARAVRRLLNSAPL